MSDSIPEETPSDDCESQGDAGLMAQETSNKPSNNEKEQQTQQEFPPPNVNNVPKSFWDYFDNVAKLLAGIAFVCWMIQEWILPHNGGFLFAAIAFGLADVFHLVFHNILPRNRLVIVFGWVIYAVLAVFVAKHSAEPNIDESGNPMGLLLPANDPVPKTIAVVPLPPGTPKLVVDLESDRLGLTLPESSKSDLFVIMGGNFITLSRHDQIPIIRFHNKNMLVLSVEKGGATISGEFFDRSQNAFAVISNNKFILDRQNFWRMNHPDKSTLIITSHQNLEVLNIRFCRTNFFSISGIFDFPDGSRAIVATNSFVYWNNSGGIGEMEGNCYYGAGVLDIKENGHAVWGNGSSP